MRIQHGAITGGVAFVWYICSNLASLLWACCGACMQDACAHALYARVKARKHCISRTALITLCTEFAFQQESQYSVTPFCRWALQLAKLTGLPPPEEMRATVQQTNEGLCNSAMLSYRQPTNPWTASLSVLVRKNNRNATLTCRQPEPLAC